MENNNTVSTMLFLTGEDGSRVLIGHKNPDETTRYFELIEALKREAKEAV